MRKNPKNTTISQTLKRAIDASGKSDYAIAKATGVAQPVINRFRNGTRDNIRIDTADKIAAFLRYSLTPDKR